MFILMIILMIVLGAFAPATSSAQADSIPTPLTIYGTATTALAIEPSSGEATYAVAGQSLYRADGNGGWQATGSSANLESTIVDSRNPDVLWAGTRMECLRGGGVSAWLTHSTDAGATWTEIGPMGFVPLASWDPGDILIAHDCSSLQVSRNGGASWAMPDGPPLGSEVTAFAVASSPDSAAGLRVLVGVTGEGGTTLLYRVSLSDPAAATVDGPLTNWWGHAPVAVTDEGSILVGASHGVLRSDDGGETWTTLRTGLETTTAEQDPLKYFPPDLVPGSFGLTALAISGEDVYVAGIDGVYRLTGEVWEKVADLEVEATAMAFEPGTGALLVQTAEPSVLRIDLAD